ncbi:toll/interleukin-1 receptor domain-containing protein, partial [Frankia sp. CIT1]|uniref:toll/interleukin-1 receptor domain-containing protein n=1 Tax=Frankia sp. CIT1 TaxID=2880974 RepID=UPI001EF62FFC
MPGTRRSGDGAPSGTTDAETGAAGHCDFFLTHARADAEWAKWIAWQLEEHVRFDGRKAQVFLEAWDIVPGSDLVANISRMLDRSDRVVPILSPHYFADPGDHVWPAAWTGDQDRLRRIVPVRVEACVPTGLLRTIHYIDLVGMDAEAAAAALRTRMSDAIKG